MGIKRNQKRLKRKLDFELLNDKYVNKYEVRDKNYKLISNDINEEIEKIDLSKHFFEVGMTENVYFPGSEKPFRNTITGCPSFNIIEYLHKTKGMSMYKLMILFYKLCEDCINELEYSIKGKKYERIGITGCEYCKEVNDKEEKQKIKFVNKKKEG